MTNDFNNLLPALERIADALERMAPPARKSNDLSAADAFVWQAESGFSPMVFRPTLRCFGARAARVKVRSSRRCMPE